MQSATPRTKSPTKRSKANAKKTQKPKVPRLTTKPTSLAEKRSQKKQVKPAILRQKQKKHEKSIEESLMEIRQMAGITELVSDDEVIVEPSPFKLDSSINTPVSKQPGRKQKQTPVKQPSVKLLRSNSSNENKADENWVEHQSRDRAKLFCLSSEKREIRLRTLQTTFDRIALSDEANLTELRSLVARMQNKIEFYEVPASAEKYLSLTVKLDLQQAEFEEDSELMEDLYKILPLTIESDFRPESRTINCQFDTAQDLDLADQILQLVFSTDLIGKVTINNSKSAHSLLQKLLQAIWCRNREPVVGKATPVKQSKPSPQPLIFSNKNATMQFENCLDSVKDAISAIDAFETSRTYDNDEDRLQAELEKNPHLIIPFQVEDDTDSEFTLTVRKCRKPRAKVQKSFSITKTISVQASETDQKPKEPQDSPKVVTGTKRTYKKALSKLASDSFASGLQSPLKNTEFDLPSIQEEQGEQSPALSSHSLVASSTMQTAQAQSALAASRSTQVTQPSQLPVARMAAGSSQKRPRRTTQNATSATSGQTPNQTFLRLNEEDQ